MQINRPRITSVATHKHASDAQVADFLEMRLKRALAKTDGGILVAFPGGSTPFPIITQLLARGLDWNRIAVFPTDDRDVPEDHEASNFGKLRGLLEPAGALVTPLAAGMEVPRFALVWLGMGEDGHIASLFPGMELSVDDEETVRAVTPDPLPPEAPYARLTMTLPTLLNSDEIVFVVRGIAKRAVFEGALEGAHDLPVRRLLAARQNTGRGAVTCFL